MCSNYFSSSAKMLMFVWMCCFLSDVHSLETTTPSGPCHKEAAIVCKNIGSAEDHREALISAFSADREIDLIFVICNTTECSKGSIYSGVINFIISLVTLVSTKYESYIDEDRLHIAVIVYDNTSARVTLNDIEKSTPKVGNCEFDQFLNDRMESFAARGGLKDGLLADSLKKSSQVFHKSARQDARKVLWLFSDCGYCDQTNKRLEVETDVGDIKRGYGHNVVIFTAGLSKCQTGDDSGYYSTLAQEDTMKTMATTNSSHYACIDQWIEFTNMEISSGLNQNAFQGNSTQRWSEIINVNDTAEGCKKCANATCASYYRCACQVSLKQYQCHDWMKECSTIRHMDAHTFTIALGAGIGGGCLLVIIIVIIVVVVVRRRKRPGPPPPPLPREGRISRTPPAPPDKPDRCPTYINSEATAETKIDAIEYEVLELERNMPGWADHLKQLKMERYPSIIHLGVYSVENDYFAQTAGFTFTESQKTALNDVMTSGNSGGNPRRTSDVTVGGVKYVIRRKTLDKLSAQTRDKKTILTVMCRYEYLVVGIAESGSSSLCDEVVQEILDAVTI